MDNLVYFDKSRATSTYDIPILESVEYIPYGLQGFNVAMTKGDTSKGVHFFLDDGQFERIWKRPEYYLDKLRRFECVLTTDFSLYTDMPRSIQLWNVYRSRLIGQMMQDREMLVIPTVSWADEGSYDFCFEGLPQQSTLAISTIGVKRRPETLALWKQGVNEMMRRLSPTTLLIYGDPIEYDYGHTFVVYYENDVLKRLRSYGRKRS